MPLPSRLDEEYLTLSRAHIDALLRSLPLEDTSLRILEIGPKLGWPHFDTLDIDPARKPKFVADICNRALTFGDQKTYDLVLCISVLEHVHFPERAIENIRLFLKPDGLGVFQAPLNVRQHGPQPDLWRFTENGWRFLLRDWDDVQIDALASPERSLFPIAYTVTAKANHEKNMKPHAWKPVWIER